MAENGWNLQKPEKIALAYTVGGCHLTETLSSIVSTMYSVQLRI